MIQLENFRRTAHAARAFFGRLVVPTLKASVVAIPACAAFAPDFTNLLERNRRQTSPASNAAAFYSCRSTGQGFPRICGT